MVGVVVVGNIEYTPPGSRGVLAAVESATGVTRRVPQDYPTIQNGVDAANPGDLVLIDKGVYTEAVFVTTPSITLRGVDRNAVILDGKFELSTGIMVGGNGVAIENMTARKKAKHKSLQHPAKTIAFFSISRTYTGTIAIAFETRNGWPDMHPSPRKSPGSRSATTASFPMEEFTVILTTPLCKYRTALPVSPC